MSATLALENGTCPTHVPEYEAILAPEKHVKYVAWEMTVQTIVNLNGNRQLRLLPQRQLRPKPQPPLQRRQQQNLQPQQNQQLPKVHTYTKIIHFIYLIAIYIIESILSITYTYYKVYYAFIYNLYINNISL